MSAAKKYTLLKAVQVFYLTSRFYIKNNLDASAAACSFGFIFSFMPIILIILSAFIHVLHASEAAVTKLVQLAQALGAGFDVAKVIHTVTTGISFSLVNAVLGIFTVWMARKLFVSIVQGLSQIFKTVAPPRPVVNQLLTFAGELLAVVIAAVTFFAAFTTRQIFSLPIFAYIAERIPLPFVFGAFSARLTNSALYVMLFLFTLTAYKFASGSHPPLKLCALYAAFCAAAFYVSIAAISFFLNRANYNTIYGVLSNLIVLLLEVYIFFILFMFFAELLYTAQYFRSLLLGELYLLPRYDDTALPEAIRRLLFLTPHMLMTPENTLRLQSGEAVYRAGSKALSVYYVVSGTVMESRPGLQTFYDTGTFFGESETLLHTNRQGAAVAQTCCTILRIPESAFTRMLERTPAAAVAAIQKITGADGMRFSR